MVPFDLLPFVPWPCKCEEYLVAIFSPEKAWGSMKQQHPHRCTPAPPGAWSFIDVGDAARCCWALRGLLFVKTALVRCEKTNTYLRIWQQVVQRRWSCTKIQSPRYTRDMNKNLIISYNWNVYFQFSWLKWMFAWSLGLNSTFQVTKQEANDQMRKNLALASALSGGGNKHQNFSVSACKAIPSQALCGPLVPHPLGELGCLMEVTWQKCWSPHGKAALDVPWMLVLS